MLAIDMEIYINNNRRRGILCITEGIIILLYKGSKHVVIPSFKFNGVKTFSMAENVPSAAALKLDDISQRLTKKSHLIIESPSMGLFMRYIIEMNFKTEIDFCHEVELTEDERTYRFQFQELIEMKRKELAAFSSGVVRSTTDHKVFKLEANRFMADNWQPQIVVVTNIGIFMFSTPAIREEPKFLAWNNYNVVEMKKSNLTI